jgi:tetratricopeptide (TPR) repeat protein
MTSIRILSVLLALTGMGIRAEVPGLERLQTAGLSPAAAAAIQSDLSQKEFPQAEAKLIAQVEKSAHPEALLEILGGVFFLDHNYLQAAIAYKKAEKYGVLSENARFTLVMSYIELKRSQWARDELQRLMKDKPAEPLYPYWLGRIDYDDQNFIEGIAKFNQTLAIDPQFVRAYDGRALCEEAIGDFAAAEQSYGRANSLNREQPKRSGSPALDYGTMLAKAGRFGEAVVLLREALTIDPSSAKAYYQLGRIDEQRSHVDIAIQNFETAVKLDPLDPSPVYALFRLYNKKGETQRAEAMRIRFQALKKLE